MHPESLNPRCQPKLMESQKIKWLAFAQEHKNWSMQGWRRVMFGDESSCGIFHRPIRQNDRVWAHISSDVAPTKTVKHPLKIMVWAMMSYQWLSEPHLVR